MVRDSAVMQGMLKACWSYDCIYNRLIRKQPSQLSVEPQWNSSRLLLGPLILTVVSGESLLYLISISLQRKLRVIDWNWNWFQTHIDKPKDLVQTFLLLALHGRRSLYLIHIPILPLFSLPGTVQLSQLLHSTPSCHSQTLISEAESKCIQWLYFSNSQLSCVYSIQCPCLPSSQSINYALQSKLPPNRHAIDKMPNEATLLESMLQLLRQFLISSHLELCSV